MFSLILILHSTIPKSKRSSRNHKKRRLKSLDLTIPSLENLDSREATDRNRLRPQYGESWQSLSRKKLKETGKNTSQHLTLSSLNRLVLRSYRSVTQLIRTIYTISWIRLAASTSMVTVLRLQNLGNFRLHSLMYYHMLSSTIMISMITFPFSCLEAPCKPFYRIELVEIYSPWLKYQVT